MKILVDGRCIKCNNVQKNMEYPGILTCEISSNPRKKNEFEPESFNFYCETCKEETIFIPE